MIIIESSNRWLVSTECHGHFPSQNIKYSDRAVRVADSEMEFVRAGTEERNFVILTFQRCKLQKQSANF